MNREWTVIRWYEVTPRHRSWFSAKYGIDADGRAWLQWPVLQGVRKYLPVETIKSYIACASIERITRPVQPFVSIDIEYREYD